MSDLEDIIKTIRELPLTATIADLLTYLPEKFMDPETGEEALERPHSQDKPTE